MTSHENSHRQEIPVRIERKLAGQQRAPAVMIAHHRFGTCADPFHRPAERPGGQQNGRKLRIDFVPNAEGAADIPRMHTKTSWVRTGDVGELVADRGCALAGQVDVVDPRARIIAGETRFRLHRIAGDALGAEVGAHDAMSLGESRIGGCAIAILIFERQVTGDLGMKLRRRRRDRIRSFDHGRQVAIAHGNPLGGILRRRLCFGDHERDRLTDEAHAVAGERRALRDLERRTVLALDMRDRPRRFGAGARDILAGEHGQHSGRRPRRAHVQCGDLRVRTIRAQEASIDLPWQVPVGGIAPATGDQAKVLASAGESVAH